jgi:hypothetical protein
MRTRTLVLIAVGVFAVIVGGFLYVAVGGGDDTRRAGALGTRSYSTGKTILYSAGAPLGYVSSSSCGIVSAPVIEAGPGEKPGKRLGPPTYDPCEITVGMGMEKELFTWINDSLNGKASAKDLSLSTVDFNYKEVGRLELKNALLSEFTLPAIDAGDKSNSTMTLTIDPQSIQAVKPTGATASSTLASKQKAFIAGNFRFDLGGSGLTKVTKIDGWSVKMSPSQASLGDLKVTVSEADPRMPELEQMMQGFLVTGDKATETTAAIVFLDPTLKNELGSINFKGVGLQQGQLTPGATSGDPIARRDFNFYVESAQLTVN